MWHKDNVPFVENALVLLSEDLYPLDVTEQIIQVPKHKCILPLDVTYSVQNILTKGEHKGSDSQQATGGQVRCPKAHQMV